jgi:Uma2 family endonuclease
MMAVGTKPYTVEEFEQIAGLPENADRRLEYIGGEIVEMVSNNYSSLVAALIVAKVFGFVLENHLGYVTGADGAYQVGGERYIPDVAFVSKARQPEPSHDAYNPNPPDLAVEVLSPTDDLNVMRFQVAGYMAAGTTVWVVDADKKLVEIYAPGQPPTRKGADEMLEGGDLLPGFTLAVKDIFPE